MVRRQPEEPGRFFIFLDFWGMQALARQDAVLSGIPMEYTISKKSADFSGYLRSVSGQARILLINSEEKRY